MNKRLLNLEEVSEWLGITVNTLYSWTCQRKIPYYKVGRLLKFDEKELESWLKDRHVE